MYYVVTATALAATGVLTLEFSSGALVEVDLASWASGPGCSGLADPAYRGAYELMDGGTGLAWPDGPEISAEALFEAGALRRGHQPGELPESYAVLAAELYTPCYLITGDEAERDDMPLYPVWCSTGEAGRGFYYIRADLLEGGLHLEGRPAPGVPAGFLDRPLPARLIDEEIVRVVEKHFVTVGGKLDTALVASTAADWTAALATAGIVLTGDQPSQAAVRTALLTARQLALTTVAAWREGRWHAAAQALRRLNVSVAFDLTDVILSWTGQLEPGRTAERGCSALSLATIDRTRLAA